MSDRYIEDINTQITEKLRARDALKIKNDTLYSEIAKNITRRRELHEEIEKLETQKRVIKFNIKDEI
jgi:hypothetical protein